MRRDLCTAGTATHAVGRGSQLQRQQMVPDHPEVTPIEPVGKGRVRLLRPVLPAVRAFHVGLRRLADLGARPARTDSGMDRPPGLVPPVLEPLLLAPYEPGRPAARR